MNTVKTAKWAYQILVYSTQLLKDISMSTVFDNYLSQLLNDHFTS